MADDQLLGFIELEEDGHIDCTYVYPQFQRTGVARLLYDALETKARQQKIQHLYVEASIVARPFFEGRGFSFVKENCVSRNGESFTNFTLEKHIP